MSIYICNILIRDKKIKVYLGNEKANREDCLNITTKDFDKNWYNQIYIALDKKCKKELDMQVYFLKIYIFSMLKRKFTYMECCDICSNLYDKKQQLYTNVDTECLFEELINFLTTNNYEAFLLEGLKKYYDGQSLMNSSNLQIKSNILTYVIFQYRVLKRSISRRTLRNVKFVIKKINRTSKLKDTKKSFKMVQEIITTSESGCLFYVGEVPANGHVFIKRGDLLFADIEAEKKVSMHLSENSEKKQLYMLPLTEVFRSNSLCYNYVENHNTLQDILKDRALNLIELNELADFFINILTDLDRCNVIHRDIKLDNILVNQYLGNILKFTLIDFGCGVITDGNESLRTSKHKERYAGSEYRYMNYSWNDAASCYMILMKLNNDEDENIKKKANLIKSRFIDKRVSY